MAISGVITNVGLSAAQDATLNEGYNLVPTRFGVSDVAGTLDVNRTAPTSGQFFTAPISSRVVIDQNTIKFVLTVPPGNIPAGTFKIVREVYLYINDFSNNEILFAVGQPTEELRYNADQELTLDVEFAIINFNVLDKFEFKFTQATEISEHNMDPGAHPEFIEAMRKAGIFIPAGSVPFERRGQSYEDNNGNGVEFDGTKATFTASGVTFTSTFNGTELNGSDIVFDGTKTVDEIRLEFNAANFPNTVEHDGVGTEIIPSGTETLLGGSYVVQDRDLVYKDLDGVFKRAIADGTIKSRVAGVAFRDEKLIVTSGLIDINTGYPISTPIYLAGDTPGAFTNFDTNLNLGIALGDYILFTGFSGDVTANVSQDFDAVVTNASGIGQFQETQLAIDAVPSDGRILIAKLDQIQETLDTKGKNIQFVFNGPNTGWQKFAGAPTSFRVDFDAVPTQGTFRIEWNGQETNDIPFNAVAIDVQNEFNLLEGSNGFTVTGDFSTGFVFVSNDLNTYPLPTFVFSGTNETQRYDFSNVPNDGTFQIRHKGQDTINVPYDDSASDLELALENLSTISDVVVTGSFAAQFFEIEFVGGFLNDGVQEQPLMQVIMSDLEINGVATTDINGTTILPVDASVVTKGKKPASNLFNVSTPINITVVDLQSGLPVGPDKAMIVDAPNVTFKGFGQVSNFVDGIEFLDAADLSHMELYFPNTTNPVLTEDKLPGVNYDIEALGYAKDVLSQLRITEHPTNKKRVKISGADGILASGIRLTSALNSLLMDFDGAEIDFSADPIQVFSADGVTPLGLDIPRPVIAQGSFRWFSLNLVPELANSDLSLKAQILLLPANADSPSLDGAGSAGEKAPLGDTPIGLVAIEGALGDQEQTLITTVGDIFGNLKGTTLTLEGKLSDTPGDTESVAFWFSDESLDTFPVQDTTGVTGTAQDLFNSTTTRVMAGRIAVTGPLTVDTVNLYVKKNGAPTGTFTVRILGESGGEPDLGNVIATGLAAVDVATQVPTNFVQPVRVEMDSEQILATGNYYVEIDGDNLVLSAGNFLGWNTEDNGSTVEVFNRDPSNSTWLSDLGNRTAHFELVDKQKGVPVLAQAADRNVEITTLLDGDLQSVVATKLHAAINADVLFSATLDTNRVTVTNQTLGVVTDADMGDTGFFASVLIQGTDTDTSGVEDISNKNILQFSAGVGSGGGSGNANSFLEELKFMLKTSSFEALAHNIFEAAQGDKVDSSDGSYSFPDRAWSLSTGEQVTNINMISSVIYDNDELLSDILKAQFAIRYKAGAIDTGATYEISKDGGNNYETMTAERITGTDTFVADHVFDDSGYTFATLQEYPSSNNDSLIPLNSTSNVAVSQEIDTGLLPEIYRSIELTLNKVGAPTGNFFFSIYGDDSGSPDLGNILFTGSLQNIESLSAGSNTVAIEIPASLAKGSTKYHISVETDDVYKSTFDGGNNLNVEADSSGITIAPSQLYDGTAFTVNTGVALTYKLDGRVLDLRVRVTASTDALIEGYGVIFLQEAPSVEQSKYPLELIYFSGDDDRTLIEISQFRVNADTLILTDLDTAQVWSFPSFSLSGNNIVVPSGTFLREGELIRLKATLIGGGTFSNDDNINSQLAENHVWSGNGSQDKSSAGRGNTYKDGNNNNVEMALDENGMIAFILKV